MVRRRFFEHAPEQNPFRRVRANVLVADAVERARWGAHDTAAMMCISAITVASMDCAMRSMASSMGRTATMASLQGSSITS